MSDVVIIETVPQVLEVSQGPQGPAGVAGPGVTISASPPASPTAGDWWIDSSTLQLFAYYYDGDSSQWVGVVSGAPDQVLAGINAASPVTWDSGTLTIGFDRTLAVGTTTYAATVTLDMATLNGLYRTITLTGNVTFASSNRAAGRSVTLRLLPDASARTLTFPAGWVFLGTTPTTLAANKTAVLSITFFGTADTDAVCAYAVQP